MSAAGLALSILAYLVGACLAAGGGSAGNPTLVVIGVLMLAAGLLGGALALREAR